MASKSVQAFRRYVQAQVDRQWVRSPSSSLVEKMFNQDKLLKDQERGSISPIGGQARVAGSPRYRSWWSQ